MDICTSVLYWDILYGDVKTFHFYIFMWIDPDEYICECNLSPEIYLIFKCYMLVH